MNITRLNVKTLVKNCNTSLSIQGLRTGNLKFRLTLHDIVEVDGEGTVAYLVLSTDSHVAKHKVCTIVLNENNVVSARLDDNLPFKISLGRRVEIEQLIVLILPELMWTGKPIELIITQSISGWTNAKVVLRADGKYTCIHSSVIRQVMEKGLANIKNAKFGKNGSILVDYKNYKQTNYNCGPTELWWD